MSASKELPIPFYLKTFSKYVNLLDAAACTVHVLLNVGNEYLKLKCPLSTTGALWDVLI